MPTIEYQGTTFAVLRHNALNLLLHELAGAGNYEYPVHPFTANLPHQVQNYRNLILVANGRTKEFYKGQAVPMDEPAALILRMNDNTLATFTELVPGTIYLSVLPVCIITEQYHRIRKLNLLIDGND